MWETKMNNSNPSEMVLDSQNQMIDLTEYALDSTALESVSGGDWSDDIARTAGAIGRVAGDAYSAPYKAAWSFGVGFAKGFWG
jgi:hypothetical protein